MNNNITEDYCSFEVSKLLKEKGFAPINWKDKVFIDGKEQEYLAHWHMYANEFVCRPTHNIAIKWIRENQGYHITICLSLQGYYYYSIQMTDGEYQDIIQETYKKPEDAVEAALLYTLKNLI